MPWKKTTGAQAPSVPFSVVEERSTSLLVERGSPTSGSLDSWDVYVRKVGTLTWVLVLADVPGASLTVSGLESDKDYDVKAVPRVVVPGEAIVRAHTLARPSRMLRYSEVLMATPQNGMYEGDEPAESGVDGIPVVIWSPNIPSGEGFGWAYDADNLADMRAALQEFETWLLERSIVFMPAFLAGSPLGQDDGTQVRLQAHRAACAALWPWMLDFNDPVQNPAKTLGPWMLIPDFCTDATHPTQIGYQTMYDARYTTFIPAFNAAVVHYGFSEP